MLTFASAVILIRLRQSHPEGTFSQRNYTMLGLYLAYLLLGLVSVFWSSGYAYSLLQLSMITEALVFAWFFMKLVIFYNAHTDNHARFSKIFGRATAWISIAFLIGLLIDPATFYRETHGGEVARLGGFIINPNELGMLAVLGATMTYVEWKEGGGKVSNALILILCVLVLLLTQSRSSLGAFLLVTAVCVLIWGSWRLKIASVAAAVAVLPILFRSIIVKQGDIQEVMSMTGRLPFWSDLLQFGFTKEPIWGYGFMRISYTDKFEAIHAYAASMTHNTFIQVLLNLGLVGGFICLLQMTVTAWAIATDRSGYYKVLASLMLIPLLINSFTEFGIFGESNYGIQFYQFLLFFFIIGFSKSKINGTS